MQNRLLSVCYTWMDVYVLDSNQAGTICTILSIIRIIILPFFFFSLFSVLLALLTEARILCLDSLQIECTSLRDFGPPSKVIIIGLIFI
jgi:accessory gene regulator protein AgrB